MVTKLDLGLLGLGALAVFLIIRGAGQGLAGLTDPLGLKAGGEALGGVGTSIQNFFGNLPNPFAPAAAEEGPSEPEVGPPAPPIGGTGEALPIDPSGGIFDFFGNIFGALIPTAQEPETAAAEPEVLTPAGGGGGISVMDQLRTLLERFDPNRSIQFTPAILPEIIDPASFQGGGPSFEGGFIAATPIENLSLNQIIERFNVSASQAADIRARARGDFGDFDFGTNLGLGFGGVFQDPSFSVGFPSPFTNVSDPQFQGLSPEQIALQLTGGPISNF